MKKFKTKIEKILESETDEREILENGKIFQQALDKIVLTTDTIWSISFIIVPFILYGLTTKNILGTIYLSFLTGESLMCLIIDLITLIYINKTLKNNTFGGNINKKTFGCAVHIIIHILTIIAGILGLIGINIIDQILIISYIIYPITIVLIIVHFTKNKKY